MFTQSLFSLSTVQKYVQKLSRADWLLVFFFTVGSGLVVYGFSLLILTHNQQLLVSADSEQKVFVGGDTTPQIIADVSGAVTKPGLYTVAVGTRVGQLIEKAAGVTDDADTLYITKEMHLAEVVKDGDKIYVPFIQDSFEKDEKEQINSSASGTSSDKVSINSASIAQLTSLSGIGEKRAADIVENRPYSSLQDLVEKEVLTKNLLQKVENLLKI
jgi:competence protein ComEA